VVADSASRVRAPATVAKKSGANLAGIRKSVGQVTLTDFRKAIKAGKSFPCVLFMGPEEYLQRADAEYYIDSLVPASHRDFDLTRIAGDELKEDKWPKSPLRVALTQLPLLGSYRVLLVDNAGDLKKEIVKGLIVYLKSPNPALRLLLVDSREKLREEPLKELLEHLVAVSYQYLEEGERIDWVINYLREHRKRITDEAVHCLVQTSTQSLSELAAKLDHATLFVGDVPEIDIFAVQRISGITSKVTVFDLERALHKGSLSESLQMARRILEGGESVLKLIAYLHRSLILIWQILRIPHSKDKDQELRRILGKRYFVKDQEKKLVVRDSFVRAAKVMRLPTIERALLGLLDLEITLKTRTVEEDILFYHWLWQVMGPNRGMLEPLAETGS